MSVRTPRSTKQATVLLERFAVLEGAIAGVEAERNTAIADANSTADGKIAPLREERDDIRTKLEPWWKTAAAELTAGKRKSVELGGCMLGTRSSRDALAVTGDEDAIVAKLQKRSWAKDLLRVTVKLNRTTALKAIGGTYAKQLKALGLDRRPGTETFFIERAEQAGTVTGASA